MSKFQKYVTIEVRISLRILRTEKSGVIYGYYFSEIRNTDDYYRYRNLIPIRSMHPMGLIQQMGQIDITD